MYDFNIKSTYNFEVYPKSIIGQDFRGVKVLAIMDASTAIAGGEDVETLHNQVYGHLPNGTPKSYLDQTYLKIIDVTGTQRVIATTWIIEGTIVKLTSSVASIRIPNVSPQEVPVIMSALSSSGFKNVQIELIPG